VYEDFNRFDFGVDVVGGIDLGGLISLEARLSPTLTKALDTDDLYVQNGAYAFLVGVRF
jgi:hypothetical protein